MVTLSNSFESYASVSEADTYASALLETGWAALSTEQKEAYLYRATQYLETSYTFKGVVVSYSQTLAWPRTEVYDSEDRLLSATEIPTAVKHATIELALIAMADGKRVLTAETDAAVKSLQAGSVSITFDNNSQITEPKKFEAVDRILSGLIEHRSGRGGAYNISLERS